MSMMVVTQAVSALSSFVCRKIWATTLSLSRLAFTPEARLGLMEAATRGHSEVIEILMAAGDFQSSSLWVLFLIRKLVGIVWSFFLTQTSIGKTWKNRMSTAEPLVELQGWTSMRRTARARRRSTMRRRAGTWLRSLVV